MALVYRAHFALIRSPRFTNSGQCTSAVFGFANTLLDLIGREQPTHLAAAFDTQEPTARHVAFPEYKAHRDAMPEDLSSQLPLIDQLMEAFNVPIIRLPGYEADDVIGTLASQAEAEGFSILMVTPDKDYDQLVSSGIRIWKPGRQGSSAELIGIQEVLQKWEVQRVDQVIDILALMGDSSDNIPGVPGIGPKTAVKLIQQFGSLENVLANASSLKGKLRENLENFDQQARLSKQLVTIQLDVPHNVQFSNLVWKGFDADKLTSLFQVLEFETLGKRLFGDNFEVRKAIAKPRSATPVPKPNEHPLLFEDVGDDQLANIPQAAREVREDSDLAGKSYCAAKVEYKLVTNQSERETLVNRLLSAEEFCFDTETTGLDPRLAGLLGIAFAIKPSEAFYVVCQQPKNIILNGSILDPPANVDYNEAAGMQESEEAYKFVGDIQSILEQFRPVLENENIEKVGHNLKYDMTVLKWHGIDIRGSLKDTMLAHIIQEPEMDHGLDHLSRVYLGYETIKIEELIGPKGPQQLNMSDVPIEKVGPYACEDADITLRIAEKLLPEIDARGLQQVCYDVEFPELSRLLADEGMDILFVPFLTDTQNGYSRVRNCAQARAIENECYVAIAGSVGNLPKVHNMDINYAQSMVFTPCDFAFPANGIKAEATPNTEMIVIADLDIDLLRELNQFGSVRNLRDRRKDIYELKMLKK